MTRPLRLQFPGAVYHAMSRGNERQDIFRDDIDRRCFLATLRQCVERFRVIVHAWCLMGNHYHLVLQTPEGNLSRAMRHLNGVYAQRFNHRHRRVGHLFQGRFTSELIEEETYFLVVCRYVVLNPVRAEWVKNPADYAWSSYRATAGLAVAPDWLHADLILAHFDGSKRSPAARRFRQFVQAGIRERMEKPKPGTSRGAADSWKIEAPGDVHAAVQTDREIPRAQRLANRPPLREILSRGRDGESRDRRICRAYQEWGYTMSEIADYIGVHYATVSRTIKRSFQCKT